MKVIIDDQDEHLTTYVTDKPDPAAGNACHEYEVQDQYGNFWAVSFQHGPIKEHGVTGVQHRQLLKILEHRLQGFQEGPFASDLNAETLRHVTAALESDARRTRKRTDAGVEGTSGALVGLILNVRKAAGVEK